MRSAGIAATVLPLEPQVLYGTALATNRIDAIVGWHAAGAISPRCSPRATAAGAGGRTGRDHPGPVGAHAARRRDADLQSVRRPGNGPLVRAPSNLTGICDRAIQQRIDAALVGAQSINDVIAAVEPSL